jgi:2-C-methyl-D-erythritol 4-phosphate cytidylyltransferase
MHNTTPACVHFHKTVFFIYFPLKNYVIIVAGGSGTRMKSHVPKQFLELNGKPILMHTINRFIQAIPDIHVIVVLPSLNLKNWEALCVKNNFTIPHQITEGGETRFHSVKNGLALIPEDAVVGIHDAARPLVGISTIIKAYQTATSKGNAIPAIPLTESVREVIGTENKAVPRDNYFIIQTPQCFQSTLIKKAFLQEYNSSFTDDASVLEANGEKINLIEGNQENIKITTPIDFIIAQQLIKSDIQSL